MNLDSFKWSKIMSFSIRKNLFKLLVLFFYLSQADFLKYVFSFYRICNIFLFFGRSIGVCVASNKTISNLSI